MNALITGAGLVGSQIAHLEQAAGRRPVLFDIAPRAESIRDFVDLDRCALMRGDLGSPLALIEAIRKHDVATIIHTAAYPGLTVGGLADPLGTVQVNILGTVHVLEAARIMGVQRVVLCSSSAIYTYAGGEDAGGEGMEEAYPRPMSLYATTKQASEDLGLNYARTYGIDVVCVRFSSVFGPWRSGGGGIATVQMESMLRSTLAGSPVTVERPRREWVYSKDAALGTHLAATVEAANLKDRVFNIGMGVSIGGEEMAVALNALGTGAEITVVEPPAGSYLTTDRPPMDATRAREQLGFVPQYLTDRAISDYADWMRS